MVNNLPDGQVDLGCRHDSQVAIDRAGDYTFVVGTEAQRAAIEKIPGATFLPFSLADPTQTQTVVLRNFVPGAGFRRRP